MASGFLKQSVLGQSASFPGDWNQNFVAGTPTATLAPLNFSARSVVGDLAYAMSPGPAPAPSLPAAFEHLSSGPTRSAIGFDTESQLSTVRSAQATDVGYNGSSVTTTGVPASGDQRIDGLLYGTRWSGGFISYTDPDSSADYQGGYSYDSNGNSVSVQNEAFGQFSSQQMIAAHFALNQATYTQPVGAAGFSAEAFTNLTIDYGTAGSGAGTIRLGNSSDPGTSYAFYPQSGIYGGDVWIGPSARTPIAGNYAWHTTIHEIGHALGLKHGQDGGGPSGVALPAAWDAMEYSVMTYRSYVNDPLIGGYSNETWGYAQSWMMLDIQALQYMYGADYSSNSGNTTYTWDPITGQSFINGNLAINPGGNRIFSTIWDGGGIDTYDLSNYTSAVQVDLRAGQSSLFSTTQRAYLGDGQYARGNVYNALMFNGNPASLIENANGGFGNDTLIGNELGNTLNGGAGTDTMSGLGGDDYYVVDNTGDVVVESAGQGFDSVLSFIFEYNLTNNVELLALQGQSVIGRGNSLNNYLFGTSGSNYLDGGSGADYMAGGAGDDFYYIDDVGDYVFENVSEGTDWVYTFTFEYNLTNNVEALQLLGGSTVGRGNASNNYIFGTSGANYIDGGAGADYMYGYGGDDYYWVDNAGDMVFEAPNDGIDTIYSGLYEYNLPDNVEALALTGAAAVGRGNAANNYLFGTDGSNFLDGAGGADYMVGFGGDDYYWVDNLGDVVVEAAGGGNDTIFSSVLGYVLPANVENLFYIGSGAVSGNASNNRIVSLMGDAEFTGGDGMDTFVFMNSLGDSIITDFTAEDRLEIDSSIVGSVQDLLSSATQIAPDVVSIQLASGTLQLNGMTLSTLYQNANQLSVV